MGKLGLAMMKLRPPDDLMGKFGALDHEFLSNGSIRLHLWASNFNWDMLDVMQPEKENMGPQCSIVCLTFQRLCDDYQWLGPPSGYLKSFVPPFLFFLFLFFFPLSFLSLSLGGPFSSGAPGHCQCPPMPPSRYATASIHRKGIEKKNPVKWCNSPYAEESWATIAGELCHHRNTWVVQKLYFAIY